MESQKLRERLYAKVEMGGPDDCWPWTGTVNNCGYGRTKVNGKETLTHRLAYTLENGEIPEGLVVRHRCHRPECANPAHLVLGTVAENNADRKARGIPRKRVPQLSTFDVLMVHALAWHGMSQARIARMLGMTRGGVSHVLTGRTFPLFKKAADFAAIDAWTLDVSEIGGLA